jgi:hypothetical protein
MGVDREQVARMSDTTYVDESVFVALSQVVEQSLFGEPRQSDHVLHPAVGDEELVVLHFRLHRRSRPGWGV